MIAPIYPVYKHNSDGTIARDKNGNLLYDDSLGREYAGGMNLIKQLELNRIEDDQFYLTQNFRADVNGAVTLQELSWLMAKLWDIKGGLMYRATKRSARYAFRQFKVDGILPATADPWKKASGSDVLNMYTACLRKYGGAE